MRSTSRPRAALLALGLVASPFLPSSADAQLTAGSTLVLTGAADAVDIGSDGVLLTFLMPATIDAARSTGDFAAIAAMPGGAAATLAPIRVGNGPQTVPGAIVAGAFRFDISFLPSGTYGQDACYVAPAAGQRCTPYQFPAFTISPFYLENFAVGSDGMLGAYIAFDVRGTVTANGATSAFTGTIASSFPGVSYQEALFALEQQGLRGVPFTGTFVVGAPTVSVTPEPATLALVGGGLAVLGVAMRRRSRRT